MGVRGRRLDGRGRARLLPLLAAGLAVVLVLRAVVEALLLADADYGGGAVSSEQRYWTLAPWNPWFLLGGVAFALAAAAAHRAGRRSGVDDASSAK